jgi:hypothetical protein
VKAVQSLKGTELEWHIGKVPKFRILVTALAKLVSDPTSMNPEDVRKHYLLETRLSEEDEFDTAALKFISEAAEALKGFQTDPGTELTRNRLSAAIEALARVPLIGPDVAEAIRPAIGKSALQALLGPVRTWMHRTLQSVTNEAQLQAILLRLLQAGLPLYAQLRHGPIEYGKDLVALVEQDGQIVLHLYQVKVGDIDKRKWRESKEELEEMFLVRLPSLQLPLQPDKIIGFLLCNGHANPYVEPVMEAWINEQRETHGRNFEFWHLDRLVDWITDNRLVNELKIALSERGIGVK